MKLVNLHLYVASLYLR